MINMTKIKRSDLTSNEIKSILIKKFYKIVIMRSLVLILKNSIDSFAMLAETFLTHTKSQKVEAHNEDIFKMKHDNTKLL